MVEKYLSNFQILGSRIKNLRIKNDFIAFDNSSNMKRKMEISHSISGPHAFNDETSHTGIVTMNIKVSVSEQKQKFHLDLQIEGCFFAGKDAMNEKQFLSMLRINGLSSLYSIARGFIQSTTSQTLVGGSVLLPMLNVLEYSKEMDSDSDTNAQK